MEQKSEPNRSRIFSRLKEKRQEILRIAQAHGASNIRIFGSVARGEEGTDSDLDLLVDMKPECSLMDLVSLWQDLEDLLGHKVDVITEGGISPYLRDHMTHSLKIANPRRSGAEPGDSRGGSQKPITAAQGRSCFEYLNSCHLMDGLELAEPALVLSIELEITFYDSLYVAASENVNAPLYTLDKKLLVKAKNKDVHLV